MDEELDVSELVEAMDRLRRIYQQSRPTLLSASHEHIDRPERQTRIAGDAADKVVRFESSPAEAATTTIVLVAGGHACRVEREQAPVRDCDAVGVAREIGERRFRAAKGDLA
jgi:hypothetical protein